MKRGPGFENTYFLFLELGAMKNPFCHARQNAGNYLVSGA